MPVPKKRTTKAAKGQRRSHHSLSSTQLVTEKTSGASIPRRNGRQADCNGALSQAWFEEKGRYKAKTSCTGGAGREIWPTDLKGAIMSKLKTNKSAAKRLRLTSSGKVKRRRAFGNHILTKKSAKRMRHLKKTTLINIADRKAIQDLLPYGGR
jgi:large subunit ribosomal protein L35